MSEAKTTPFVTAGTLVYGLPEVGGLAVGKRVVLIDPGPVKLLAAAMADSPRAGSVVVVGTHEVRSRSGRELGAEDSFDACSEDALAHAKELNDERGAQYVVDCAGNESSVNRPCS